MFPFPYSFFRAIVKIDRLLQSAAILFQTYRFPRRRTSSSNIASPHCTTYFTLDVPIVANINFLQTILVQNQEKKSWDEEGEREWLITTPGCNSVVIYEDFILHF